MRKIFYLLLLLCSVTAYAQDTIYLQGHYANNMIYRTGDWIYGYDTSITYTYKYEGDDVFVDTAWMIHFDIMRPFFHIPAGIYDIHITWMHIRRLSFAHPNDSIWLTDSYNTYIVPRDTVLNPMYQMYYLDIQLDNRFPLNITIDRTGDVQGISPIHLEDRPVVFPNPTSHYLHFPGPGQLYDSVGRLLIEDSDILDVSSLSAGTYYLRCAGTTTKVVIR